MGCCGITSLDAVMLNGINLKEFLSTHQEWHAFIEGFCDGFCAWKMRCQMSSDLQTSTSKEHHYYNFGRVLGFISLIGFAVGVIKVLL